MLGTVRHSICESGEKVTLISNQYWVVYTELGRFTQLMWIGFVIAAVYSGELLSRRSGAGLTDTQKRFSAESYPPQRSLPVSENLLTHSSFSLCYSQPRHTHARISWNKKKKGMLSTEWYWFFISPYSVWNNHIYSNQTYSPCVKSLTMMTHHIIYVV